MMDIPRDVIMDLLPLYVSGDVSPATRELVEAFLAEHPDVAAMVASSATVELQRARPAVSDDVALHSLRRTRGKLARQRWLFGLAWAFTAIALALRITTADGHVSVELLLLENFRVMVVPLAVAVALWVLYFAGRGSDARLHQ